MNDLKIILAICLALAIVLLAIGEGCGPEDAGTGRLDVVTTTTTP